MKILKAILTALTWVLCGLIGMVCGHVVVTYLPVAAQMMLTLVCFGIVSYVTCKMRGQL